MRKRSMRVLIAFVLTVALTLGLGTTSSFAATKAKSIKLTNPSKKTYTMYKGKTKQFKYRLKPRKATKKVKWTSSKKKVATVSKKGKVKAKNVGRTTIKVKSVYGKKSDRVRVIVKDRLDRASISGNMTQGSILKANKAPAAATVNYQWYRDGSAISGATASTYKLTAADTGKIIQVRVTGKGYYTGSLTATASKRATAPVTGVNIDKTTASVGDTITATPAPEGATVAYQWYRDNTAISGATARAYTTTAADLGKTIKVVVSGTGSYTGTVASAATSKVTAPITAVALSETAPVIGDELSAILTPKDATATYSWKADGVEFSTDKTVTLTKAQYDKVITVTVTGTGLYTSEVTSQASEKVESNLASDIQFSKAVCTSEMDNQENINEMMDALWNGDGSAVQGIEVNKIFSAKNNTLTINGDNVTEGVLTWVKTQWGGTSVPVAIDFSVSEPAELTKDANWNYQYVMWVDLTTTKSTVKDIIPMANKADVAYELVFDYAAPELAFAKAEATGNFENTANVNEMMDALWNGDGSAVQGIEVNKIFSAENNTLTINGDNVTAELLAWTETQWGGTSVPVAVEATKGTPSELQKDANWNDKYVVWIDLKDRVLGETTETVAFEDGTSADYILKTEFTAPKITFTIAKATGNFENTENVNKMMNALWNGSMEVDGIQVGKVLSSSPEGVLTINGNNVSAELLKWVETQWGGTSVPVQMNLSKGTPVELQKDVNWDNQYVVWVDLTKRYVNEEISVDFTNGTSTVYKITG